MKIKSVLLHTAAIAALALGSLTPAHAKAGKVIALGIGALVGHAAGKAIGKEASKVTPAERQDWIRNNHAKYNVMLDDALVKIRSGLPQKLQDEDVVFYWTNAQRDGDWLIMVYILAEPSDVFTAEGVAAWKRQAAPALCAEPSVRDALFGGYGWTAWAYNPDRKTVLGKMIVTAADCPSS